MATYEMWDSSGSEQLTATTQPEAIAEMDKRFPWWRDDNTETALHEVGTNQARLVYPEGIVGTWEKFLSEL